RSQRGTLYVHGCPEGSVRSVGMTASREPPALAGLIASQACATLPRSRAYPAGLLDEFPEFDRFPKISARSRSRCTRSPTGGYRLNRPVPGPKMLRPQAD